MQRDRRQLMQQMQQMQQMQHMQRLKPTHATSHSTISCRLRAPQQASGADLIERLEQVDTCYIQAELKNQHQDHQPHLPTSGGNTHQISSKNQKRQRAPKRQRASKSFKASKSTCRNQSTILSHALCHVHSSMSHK